MTTAHGVELRAGLVVFLAAMTLALPAGAQRPADGERGQARPVIVQEDADGRLQAALTTNPRTNIRSVQLAGKTMPAFPTIDITCDGKLRTFPLTRSQAVGSRTVTVYEVPRDAAHAMLRAGECRLFVPGGQFYGRTKPERCYATTGQAMQDGCRRSKR